MNRRGRKKTPTVASLTIPADYSPAKTGVTQSLFKRWLRCRYDFLFAVNRWRFDKGGATTGFGSIMHEMLDGLYSRFARRGKLPTSGALETRIETYCIGHRDEMLGIDAQRLERYKAIIHLLLVEYIAFYTEDFTEKKWLGCEEIFDEPYEGVRRRGKIDGRFELRNGMWLFETKTMSRVQEDLMTERLNLDMQNLFYIAAAEQKFRRKAKGVLYNVIRNPAFGKVNESLPELIARLRTEVRRRPEHFFIRYECVYNDRDKSQYRDDLTKQLADFVDFCKGHGRLYRNHTSCDHKYPCDYLHACASGKLAGYTQVKSLFPELEG